KVSGGAVDYDINFSKSFERSGDSLVHFFRVAHVGGERERFTCRASAAGFVDGLSGGLEMLHATADQRHVRTRFREGAGDAASYARTAASDKGNAAFQDSVSKNFHMC